jgi:hypothetical protein
MRFSLLLLATLALALGAPVGLAAEKPGKDELLLLGLRAKDGSLTTWLVDGSGVQRAAPGIVVPRKGGYWQVGNLHRTGNGSDEARIVALPWGKEPSLAPLDVVEGCGSHLRQTLLFAGPDFFSYEFARATDCDGAHGLDSVRLVTSSYEGAPLDVTEAYGSAAAAAWEHAAGIAHGDAEKRRDDCFADAVRSDIALVRHRAGWGLRGVLGPLSADVCPANHEFFLASYAPPEKVVGADGLPPGWDGNTEARPDLADGVGSPSGLLVVYLRASSLEVEVGGKTFAAAVPAEQTIVMAQWATGKTAAKWRAEVPKLSLRAAPE